MAHWYINDQQVSNGAGTAPTNAAWKLSDILGSTSPGDFVWVASEHGTSGSDGWEVATTYSICGATGFKTNPLRIVGWPKFSNMPFYSTRPSAGISAGWDSHASATGAIPEMGNTELPICTFFNYANNQGGTSYAVTLPTIQRGLVPFFTYHGVYIYNLYVDNRSSSGMFVLNSADLSNGDTHKMFIAENCAFQSPTSISAGYFSTRGDVFVWGEGQPQVHYIDCYIDIDGGYLYNQGPCELYAYNSEIDHAYTQWDGYSSPHQQVWTENCKHNNGQNQNRMSFHTMQSEESTTVVPRWTHLSPHFYHYDEARDLTWFIDNTASQGRYEDFMTWANAQYGFENNASNYKPIVRPSGGTVSGCTSPGYAMFFPQTTHTRPGGSATAYCLVMETSANHGNSYGPVESAPKQIGRKANVQLPYAPPSFHQACWPRRLAEVFTFQGIANQPLTVSFWMAVRNADFTYSAESGVYPYSPYFRESGAHSVILKSIKLDRTIMTARGSWDGTKPNANNTWGKLTATITPEINGPVWCYIQLVALQNQRSGTNDVQYATYLLDPVPEVT